MTQDTLFKKNVAHTSMTAYHREIKTSLGTRQKVVYEEIARYENITNSELAEALGMSINRITPRVKELRDKNLVVLDKERECRITHRTVNAWRLFKEKLY